MIRRGVHLVAAAGVACLAGSALGQEQPSSVEGATSLSAKGALASPGTTPPPAPATLVPFNRQGPSGSPLTAGAALPQTSTSAPLTVSTPLPLPSPRIPPSNPDVLDRLPQASGSPMTIDLSIDPVLRFAHRAAPAELFKTTIARAVEVHPAVREAAAGVAGARAVVQQAQSGLYPVVDMSLTADHSLSRGFGDDNNSLIERIRPRGRTDADATLTQNLLDFGATARRIKASRARVEGAKADVESAADDVAMRAISAWYDLAAYRALVDMAEALQTSQNDLKAAIRTRIAQGLSAESDLARIETYTTNADARLAQFHRSEAEAEARYAEAIGMPAPKSLDRPVLPARLPATVDDARLLAHDAPQVRSAEAEARAAHYDYAAAAADDLPKIQGVIDAGRYGVFETHEDYDIRGRIVLRHRLVGGGVNARKRQAEARYEQTRAAADRAGEEAERDAAIGFSDLQSAQEEVAALEQAYVANRRARDAIAERFRVTQGNLIDVLNAEDSYFQVAASYIQAVVRADAQRLVLLQRDGALLTALGVQLPDRTR